MIEDERIISKDEKVAETLNNYFVTVTESLGLKENSEIITSTEGITDPIDQALIKYSNHPSIKKIRSLVQSDSLFHFNNVSVEGMKTETGRLNPSKATTFKNIPLKILKDSSDICAESLQITFNDGIENCSFSGKLKSPDVSSLHKTEAKTSKKNYRPVSVLPTVSQSF